MNNEIDIITLFRKIFQIFNKNKWLLLISLILSLIAAIYGYKTGKTTFSSEMLLTTNLKTEKSKDFYIKDLRDIYDVLIILQNQINSHNYNFIKNELGIDNATLIKEVKVAIPKTKSQIYPQNLKISATVYSPDILKTLQSGIINYCNNNEYLKNLYSTQLEQEKANAEIIDKRLKQADTIINGITAGYNKFAYLPDLQSVVKMELKKEQIKNTSASIVTVVNKFSAYPKKKNQKNTKAIIYFIAVFLIAMFFIFIKEFIVYLKKD